MSAVHGIGHPMARILYTVKQALVLPKAHATSACSSVDGHVKVVSVPLGLAGDTRVCKVFSQETVRAMSIARICAHNINHTIAPKIARHGAHVVHVEVLRPEVLHGVGSLNRMPLAK
jgi:hypothetical protein